MEEEKCQAGTIPKTEKCEQKKENCEPPYDTEDECTKRLEEVQPTKIFSVFLIFVLAFMLIMIVFLLIAGFFFYSDINEPADNKENVIMALLGNLRIPARFLKNPFFVISLVLYSLTIAVITIIVTAAYDIKGSYELGEHFENQCNGIYIEKERADFHAYACYNQIGDYEKEKGVFSNKRGPIKDRLKKAYEQLISAIIIILIVVSAIYLFCKLIFHPVNNEDGELYIFGNKILNIEENINTINVIRGVYAFTLLCLIILFSLWLAGNYNITNKESVLNPFSDVVYSTDDIAFFKNMNIKNFVRTQYLYISIVFSAVLISFSVTNFKMSYCPMVPTSFIIELIGLYVILMVITPLLVTTARDLRLNISKTYEDAVKELNNLVLKRVKNDSLLQKELEKNIVFDKKNTNPDLVAERVDLLADLKNIEDDEETNLNETKKTKGSTYKNVLYMYLPHIIDDTHIRGIPIPQELKALIDTRFLAGEQAVELKQQFIETHTVHKRNQDEITKETLTSTTDKSLRSYLKDDIRLQIDEGLGSNALLILNKYLVKSDVFNKGNPLPKDIIRELELLRKNTAIKKTIDDYFFKINTFITAIMILIMYYIYHNIYSSDANIKIQYVSMAAFVIMLIFGLIGWWAKEMWL